MGSSLQGWWNSPGVPFLGPQARAAGSRAALDESPLFRPLPYMRPWGDRLQQQVSNCQSEGSTAPEVTAGATGLCYLCLDSQRAGGPVLPWSIPRMNQVPTERGTAGRGGRGG